MATNGNEKPDWFTVFRTATDEENAGWLYTELTEGRLRQGWGAPGLALETADDRRVEKTEWEAAHKEHLKEDPSLKRFAILTRMLDMEDGGVVVVPKMPKPDQFTIARVSGGYRFETDGDREDFRHIVSVYRDSVRTFGYHADNDAFLISALFSRANHRSAVSFCSNAEQVEAAHRLLQRQSSPTSKPQKELARAAINNTFKDAATALCDQVKAWNGPLFEKAVRQAFEDQGYKIEHHRPFNGQGADADILVSPPASLYGLFLPTEIAVQVKWKQGLDEYDDEAVKQIDEWVKWQEIDAAKYVISSASGFTDKARELAAANDVHLIGGLQTMCFLLGVPDRYRDDWD